MARDWRNRFSFDLSEYDYAYWHILLDVDGANDYAREVQIAVNEDFFQLLASWGEAIENKHLPVLLEYEYSSNGEGPYKASIEIEGSINEQVLVTIKDYQNNPYDIFSREYDRLDLARKVKASIYYLFKRGSNHYVDIKHIEPLCQKILNIPWIKSLDPLNIKVSDFQLAADGKRLHVLIDGFEIEFSRVIDQDVIFNNH